MLTIRKDQFDAMDHDVRVRNIGDIIRKAFPDACEQLGSALLTERIETGLQKAESHGITELSEVTRFVQLMFVFGEDFDAADWAATILHWTDVANEFKLQALEKRAEEEIGDKQ